MKLTTVGKRWMYTLSLALFVVLTACGDGTAQPPGGGTIFTDENAWEGATDGAKIVSQAEFERLVKSGEIELETLKKRQDRFDVAQAKIQADVAFLNRVPAAERSPDLEALLETKVALPTMSDGNYVNEVTLADGSSVNVVTLGTPAMAALITESYQRSSSLDNQLEAYRMGYEAAPEAARAGLPLPDSLKGKGLSELLAARDQLDDALEALDNLDRIRVEDVQGLEPQAVVEPGDEVTACGRAPAGISANFWWPLKNFQTDIKQQGMRGTCWAFAAAAVLESREMVMRDQTLNLSEQFIVNKVKREWGASDFNDGGGAEWALERAVDNNFRIPLEQFWPYNPAYGRPADAFSDGVVGTMASYRGACNPVTRGADTLVYNWSCSETAHQSPWICAPAGDKNFCGYFRMVAPAGAAGVLADRTTVLWHNLWGNAAAHRRIKKFPLAEVRNQLASGRVLMASFGVFRGFDNPDPNGFVTDFSSEDGRGGHIAVIVGYIDNATLHARLPNAPQHTRGFFILKNSWGCAADGGYYYIPVDYVTRYFSDLSVLNMSDQRGANWRREQRNPAANDPSTIAIRANPARVDLRVETDLAQFFRVSQPAVKSVTLSVISDRDGTLYNGPWSTDTGALVGPSLKRTFTSQGPRVLSLLAQNGGTQARATLNVNVVNSPPILELQHAGDPRQGEGYSITALVRDINESDGAKLCANTTWSVDAPDVVSSTTGCQVTVTFGATGSRTVRVSTRDSEGLTAAANRTLTVLPPPENPYPRIVRAGVYSRQEQRIENQIVGCNDVSVTNGNTIDFREKGCVPLLINPPPPPPRYTAQLEIENPASEALTYDWRVFVTFVNPNTSEPVTTEINTVLGSSDPTFTPYSPGNAVDVTNDCRISVTVNAPEPARSKSLTVWSGKCTYLSTRLN